ncbi:T9SS type B sorting domain-containing protein [Aquimarina sp. U1-2]|uniref:T9SS type B sorting domain-containing protein n=1 Tax=Aquimarina sp. U1-2 TaxID=2823141 RepID=UPI001AECFCB9|nr:T9SS type B sorting domain-containing protein [Aquimarina sp. U1-2]MBP2833842.1 T9SS type B sorting domain-containing protein [Aquimarina sp. U1-2]
MERKLHYNKQVLILLLIFTGYFSAFSQIRAPSSVPFEVVPNSTHEIRGELKMIGNTIISPTIRGNGSTRNPNDPYNFRDVENGQHRAYGYIDVDSDPNTESSSSADFVRNSTCGQVVYAGLYWSATYYDVNQTTVLSNGDLRPNYETAIQPDPRDPYNVIKFKPPNAGGNYRNVTADRILYDGYPGSPFNPNFGPNDTTGAPSDPNWPNINTNAVVDMPYHCYADVTSIVRESTNPDGTYFVADQKATVGPIVDLSSGRSGSRNDLAAGWTLVIIYEDPSLPRKYISSNYGLAAISQEITGTVDFTYSGFTTLPTPLAVNARYGIGTYEGDQDIPRDNLQVEYQPFGSNNFQNVSVGPENLAGNFFDSTITVDGDNYLSRNPASENCLGYDVDIFPLQESNSLAQNVIIGNSQNAVNFRLITGSDKYQVFVNTFEVEIIAPELVMIKRILRADASEPSGFEDITDGNVNFNEEIFYDITIQNVGNEDLINTTILDILPVNIDFVDFDVVSPGITLSRNTSPTFTRPGDGRVFDTPNGSIFLELDDNIVRKDDPAVTFRFRVRVVEDCASLRDACSNEIRNVAASQYTGVISTVTDEADSVVERDDCEFNVVGASTFLINEGTCFDEADTARLCDNRATLQGGEGFDTYRWTRADDPTDSSFPRTTQDIVVTEAGTYVVATTSVDCQDTRRQFVVEEQSVPVNPIANIARDIISNPDDYPNANGNFRLCGSTNEEVAEIFLCGSGTLNLDSGLGDTTVWQRLRNGACPDVPRDPDCPTEATGCDDFWDQVFVGETFVLDPSTGDVSGEYRILTTVDGDCPDEIYFNVFQSNFSPEIRPVRDIICGTPGALEVRETPNQFEYQLVFNGTPIGGFQEERLFENLTNPGSYAVDAREINGPAGACVFRSNSITINAVDPIVEATVTRQPSCLNGTTDNTTGRIEVRVTGGLPTYRYVLTDGPAGFIDREISGSADPTAEFSGLLPGNYTLNAYSDDDDDDTNCFDTISDLIINPGNPLTVSVTREANLACNPDFNPGPVPPGEEDTIDDARYVAFVDLTITSTPDSGNYRFSTNSNFSLSAFYITPVEVTGNVYRFRFETAASVTIYVQDRTAGCTANGATTINDVVEIEATATVINPPCFNELGAIDVNVTAGSGPFTFLIDGNPATPATSPGTADGLGNYIFENIDPATSLVVTVQNGVACDEELDPVSFTVPDEIVITLGDVTELSCPVGPNAAVEVRNIEGGSGTYEYSLDDPNGTYTAVGTLPFTITNIADSGPHVVYVRNVVTAPTPSCRASASFQVQPLREVDEVIVTTGNVNCTAETTEVTLSANPTLPSGATYSFTVTPAALVTAGVYTLDNGTSYTIEATRSDSNCTAQTIFPPTNIPVAVISDRRQISQVSCNGGNDGVFEFTVSNGSTTDPVTSFDYTITGPGTNITVNNNTTNPVTITGSATTPIVAGTYTITITDRSLGAGSTGCTDTQTVVITQPDAITFTPNITDQDCATNLNEVSVSNVTGGNGPTYTFQVSHPTNGTFGPASVADAIGGVPNIDPADPVQEYTVTVFDVTGTACSASSPLTITPLTPLEVEIDENSDICLDATASSVSFTINVDPNSNGSIGNPPYNYTVSRDGTLVQTNTVVAGPPIVTDTFSQPGAYEIVFRDSEGCEVILNQTVAPLLTLTARRVNDLICDPSTGASIDGEFELTIAGGTANYDITYENTTTSTTGNVALGVTTTASPITFNSADAGNYIFTVTDRAGSTGTRCVATDTGELTDRTTPTITAPDVNLTCDGDLGTVTITVTGPETEYFVQFDDNDPGTTDAFVQTVSNQVQIPNVPANTGATTADPNFEYNITVRDSRGCLHTDAVRVISPGPIVEFDRDEIPITCDNSVTPSITIPGSIRLTIVDRGALQYTYTLVDDSDVAAVPLIPSTNTSSANPATVTSNTIVFNDTPAGQYYIFVEDVNGCSERIGPFTVASDPSDLTIISTTIATCPALVTLNVQVVDGVGPFAIEILDPSGSTLHVDGPPLNGLPTPSGGIPERNHSAPLLPFNTRYEVRIEDTGSNCIFVQFVDPVSPPSEPNLIDLATTSISCNDGDPITPLPEDGTFTFTIDVSSLGTAPPVTQVSWAVFEVGSGAPATGTNTTGTAAVGAVDITETVTDLPAGLYYIEVQEDDGTLCPTREDFEIEIPDPIVSQANNPRVAICDTEVAFSITTNGGTPTGGSNTTDEGYRYAREARGSFTPPAVPPLTSFTFDATTINDPFTIDPSVATDLQWDIYTVDDNNCIVGPLQIDIDVTPGPSIDVNPGVVSNPCALSDYTITIETSADPLALNSNGNIFYGFDDGTNPIVFDEAPPGSYTYTFPTAGTYDLVVQDNNGCEAPRPTITVFPQVDITATFITPPDCTTAPPLGIIETTLDPDGLGLIGSGATNHTYTLIDVATGLPAVGVVNAGAGRFEQVPAGEYTVRLEDSGMGAAGVSCPFETTVSIEAPDTPDLDNTSGITNTSCNAASPAPAPDTGLGDGRIEISLVGGLDPTATYQYEITGSVTLGVTRPLQDSNIFNNLAADTYTVRVVVTEENDLGTTADDVVCEDTADYVVGTAPAIVLSTPTVSPFSCDPSDNSEQFPTITIEVSGGTLTASGSYRVSYTRPAPLSPIVDEVVVDANPITPVIEFETIATVEGSYTFTFKDNNNCELSTTATVPAFNRLTNASVEVTAPGGTCVASEEVTVSIEGGTTGDTFTFAEITGAGLPVQSGIPFDNDATSPSVAETQAVFTLPNPPDESRTYRFRITNDNTGCYLEIDHTAEQVDFLDVVATQLNPERCAGDADGTIRITVSGYSFVDVTGTTILGGDITYTIIDPSTGLEIVDGVGGPISGSSGTLSMPGVDTETFDLPFGATQGNYIVRVRQVGNPQCEEEDTVIILGPNELELIVPPFITTTCDVPLNNGSFTASTNGARGTVTYTILETGATSTNGTFTGLAPTDPVTPATFTVIARDTFTDPTSPTGTSFCEDTETIEVRPPANDVTITGVNTVDVTCRGDSDGEIEVIATGTDQPLEYSITPVITGTESARVANNTFTDLIAGDYIITVYDSSNCTAVTTPPITIVEPNLVTIQVDGITDTTCSIVTADVTLTATSDLAAPYTVIARDVTLRDVISTPSSPISDADRDRPFRTPLATNATGTVTFSAVPEGIYEFYAVDSNGCESQRTGSVVITVPDQIQATLDLGNTTIVCFGEATASVNTSAISGGLGSNTYTLTGTPVDPAAPAITLGPQGSPFFNNLPAGQYTYRIESVPGSGCELEIPFEITQPDTPFEAEAIAANITCNGEEDGTITITATGGNVNSPYRFSLFRSTGERVFEFVSDEADNTIGSHVFEELSEDLTGYTVIVEDGLGCTIRIENLIIQEPAPILIDVTATTGEVCAGDNDGTATFSITGGTPDPITGLPVYFWSIDGINFEPVTDPTSLLVENLPAGRNTIFIRDVNNSPDCETPREFEIEPGVLLAAQLESRLICPVWSDPTVDTPPSILTPHRNEVEFTVSPETEALGVIYRLVRTDGSAGPAEYSGFERIFEVTPGSYDAIMLFEMCERTVGVIEVPQYTPLDIPVVQMTGNPEDPNEYEILATGGNRLDSDPFYTFSVVLLDDGGTVNDIQYPVEVDGNTFRVRETGDYLIRVSDANGCEVLVITNLTYINIRIPNYFTPNDPNATPEERFWYPRQITPNTDDPFFFENMEVKIFDRYGRMLEEFKGNQQGWSGLYQGKELPSGDYWFTVILNDVDNREFTGHFTLYR